MATKATKINSVDVSNKTIEQLFFQQISKLTKETIRAKSFDIQFSGYPIIVHSFHTRGD